MIQESKLAALAPKQRSSVKLTGVPVDDTVEVRNGDKIG